MKLLTLSCNECGAPLEVSERTKYVTCSFCSARLAVQHTSNASYTEVLEEISQRTEQLTQDVELLKLRDRLERLDREWIQQREKYKMQDEDERQGVPGAAASVIGAVIAVVFGIFWIGVASAIGAPFFFPMFGVVFIIFVVIATTSNLGKASAYAKARDQHERRRRELVARISAQESGTAGDSPFSRS